MSFLGCLKTCAVQYGVLLMCLCDYYSIAIIMNGTKVSAQGISYTHVIHVYACAVLLVVGWSINVYTTRGRLPSC